MQALAVVVIIGGLSPSAPTAGPSSVPTTVATATYPAQLDAALVDLNSTGYPEGIRSETEYQRFLDDRASALVRAANASTTPASAVRSHLAAANWILARQVEPAASRILLGIPRPEEHVAIASALALAADQLDQARAALQTGPPATQPHEPPRADTPAERELEILDTFARGIDTALARSDSDGLDEQQHSAAFRLSVLLEEDQPALASAAALWQAVLFERMNRVDRALERLPLSTDPPSPKSLRFDFYARLLRCRFLADQGRFVAAYSLLMQVEQRCHDWFTTQQQRKEAERTAAWVRLHVTNRWHDALDSSAKPQRRWCRQAVEKIRESFLGQTDRPTVMRLGTSIPMLVEIPATTSGRSTQPTSQPASLPTSQRVRIERQDASTNGP